MAQKPHFRKGSVAAAEPAIDAGAGTQGRGIGIFVLWLVARFAGAVALAWLTLFILLYLLPNAGGDPLGLQFFGERLAVTLPLVLMAGIVALLLGAGISFLAARLGGWGDRLLGGFATLLSYLPPFWLGLLLALVLAGILPVGGFMPWSAGPVQALTSLLLPGLALALPHAGQFAVRLRGAFGPEPGEAEIRGLRIVGVTPTQARWRVALARALPQLPTLVGRLLASLLVGAVVVENVFYLPGLGRQVLGAALAHDVGGLRAGLFLLLTVAALLMLLAGLGRLALDPALRGRR
jgi:peptide/nickel transport system permease protein